MEILIGQLETDEELAAAKLWRQKWSPAIPQCYGEILKCIIEKKEFDSNSESNVYCRMTSELCDSCLRIFQNIYSHGNGFECPCVAHGVFTVRDLVSDLINAKEA